MTSCIVSVQTKKHWQHDTGLVTLYANDKRQSRHPTGWYQAAIPAEFDSRKWYRVIIENDSGFSRIQVTERDSGAFLMEYDCVCHDAAREGQLLLADCAGKDPPAIEFENVWIEPLKAMPPMPDSPLVPAGYRVLFFDRFGGPATQWGSPRYLPGVLTLPKKDYFHFSYPVYIPDLVFGNGTIETDILPLSGSHGEICFRVDSFGDRYYALRFETGGACQFLKSTDVARQPEPIGQSLDTRCPNDRRWRMRIGVEDFRFVAVIDGRRAAVAEDTCYATGRVCLTGSEKAAVMFDNFAVLAKEGAQGEWHPRPLQVPKAAESRPCNTTSTRPTPIAPLPPARAPAPESGQVRDATGRIHRYALRQGCLEYDGLPFLPVRDSDGQYFVLYEPDRWPPKAWDKLGCPDTLDGLVRHGLTYPIVPLRLADYIDCAQEDHGFHEDGGIGGRSRLLRLAGDVYRVTSCRKPLPPYFVYSTTFGAINKPHVVAYQFPNDRERYLSVNPIPAGSGSGGVYTGGNYPVDGKDHIQMHVYYPPQRNVEWVFMHSINDPRVRNGLEWSQESGAAVANVWAMVLLDDPANVRPVVHLPQGPQRYIGVLEQQTDFIFQNYGVQVNSRQPTAGQRKAAFGAWLDYLLMAGCNLPDLNWLGVDWMITGQKDQVGYDSQIFKSYRKTDENRALELLPEVEARGMVAYPSVASFNLNDSEKQKFGLAAADILIDREGKESRLFGQSKLDPTSENVKSLFVRIVDELAGQVSGAACVKGISISIDGFFTLTDELGYGPNTLRRYQKAVGIEVPASSSAEAYQRLHVGPDQLKQWQAWRCTEMQALLGRLRDTLRKHRSDWVLKVKLMNKRRNMLLLRTTDEETLEILLGQGIDPKLYRQEEGIVFVERSAYESKPKNRDGTAGFDFTHGIADVPTRYGTGFQQWTGYWEQPGVFNCLSRYSIGWLASANLAPPGRHILEAATYHLRVGNTRELQYQTWERGIGAWEHTMRRFAAAFRALPLAEPRKFEEKVEVTCGPAADETLWIAWYGDRLGIVNDHPLPRTIRLRASGPFPKNGEAVELGRSRKVAVENGWLALGLAPYDLLVLSR